VIRQSALDRANFSLVVLSIVLVVDYLLLRRRRIIDIIDSDTDYYDVDRYYCGILGSQPDHASLNVDPSRNELEADTNDVRGGG
jgi:hypothetical protein